MTQEREVLYHFRCAACERAILFPAQKLDNIFQAPNRLTTDIDSVGIACWKCKHVANYSLNENSPDYRPYDPVRHSVFATQLLVTEYVKRLRCGEENCKVPLPIYGQWNESTTDEEREADIATWVWRFDLHCPKGHLIEFP
jgi:hypothetical protein